MEINIDNLPRTIQFIRSDDSIPYVPNGFPVLVLLDQTKLPYEEERLFITDWRQVIDCIKHLRVRGAPAIGIAGAAAVALRAAEFVYAQGDNERSGAIDFERVFIIDETDFDPELYRMAMEYSGRMIKQARPTAVNLAHGVDACMQIMEEGLAAGNGPRAIAGQLFEHVCAMIEADVRANRAIGANGSALLGSGSRVLTHCNAGSLATAFYGTALGVIYSAASEGKIERVYADETRPVGQGARLTVWELSRAGVPATLICDNMAASIMAQGLIDAVIVGADRIAANGDVANKIGTLGVAIAAHRFGVPFYVAAPSSTIDPAAQTGADIPIEQRDPSEVLPQPIAGVDVLNPAFDITPASLVGRIITEKGVFKAQDIINALRG